LAEAIASAWGEPLAHRLGAQDDGILYEYQITTAPAASGNSFALLQMTMTPPNGHAPVWPTMKSVPPQYLSPPDGFAVDATTRLWNFTLPIGDALDLQMAFPSLDPMVLESAWGGDRVQRNQMLLPGQETNPALVYNTPLIHFPNKIRPSLTYGTNTDLRLWGGTD